MDASLDVFYTYDICMPCNIHHDAQNLWLDEVDMQQLLPKLEAIAAYA